MAASHENEVEVKHKDQILSIHVSQDLLLTDFAQECADLIQADVERISLFITPKPGLKKYPFPNLRVVDMLSAKTKFKLIGTPNAELERSEEMMARIQARAQARQQARHAAKTVSHTTNRDWKKAQEEAMYTFHAIEPLQYLPDPSKSKRYLERLANDPGIKASMRKHKFSVGLLTEMNPAEHTTHDSKTLGLNRNRGEVIELRLRTDRYDGYRDYKVIRKTLCHELAHNVFGAHDRNFWDLTKQIESEVDRNDHLHGGRSISGEEFYNPNDDVDGGEHVDGGGWQGGEFVLGGSTPSEQGLSRREIMARAASSRIEKQRMLDDAARRDNNGPAP